MTVSAAGGRLRAAALAAALGLLGCGEPDAPARDAPAGTLRELDAENSVTTDVNARSPAFARADFAGNLVRSQDFIGSRVVLLDFWSVFCQSCLQGMPFLAALHERYAASGLEVIGINTDFFPRERIEGFMEKTGLEIPYRTIHDRDQSLSRLFSVEALPVLVLIDSDGWIRMVHLGYRPADEGEIERRVSRACRRIRETVVTLQPVGGETAFDPPERGISVLGPGAPVPDFEARLATGDGFSFATWRGDSPAVVLFWSIFCQPCREEFDAMERVLRRAAVPRVKVLAVNVDAERLHERAARLLLRQDWQMTAVFDREGEGGRHEVSSRFGVVSTPSTFVVGPEGTVRASWAGTVPEDELVAGIASAARPASQPRGGGEP